MRYTFHANVFAKPPVAIAGAEIELNCVRVTPLRGPDARALTFDAYLPVTFEQAIDALLQLPRLDVEPDGFFVLAGGSGPTHWRVSGHLFDFGDRMHRVELNGSCPPESFDALLACVGWPATPLAFELVEPGVAVDESAFRAWASRGVP